MKILLPYVLIVLFATNLQAQSHSALVEGAKKEGKLVWYTSMAIDTSKPLLDAFLKDYPFIKADLVRAGEEQLMTRIMSETRAGRWAFDVVSTSAISVLPEKKLIEPYLSANRDAYLSEFKDPQGFWTGIFGNNLIVAYNTKMVAAKDAPKATRIYLIQSGRGRCSWTLLITIGSEPSLPSGAGSEPCSTCSSWPGRSQSGGAGMD
jgi:hypothetical protein